MAFLMPESCPNAQQTQWTTPHMMFTYPREQTAGIIIMTSS